MQTALSAPLQKIGAQAQSILGNIMKFFNNEGHHPNDISQPTGNSYRHKKT